MRLIDALELKRSIAVSAILEDGKHIFDIIDEQPTVESERKKGKWIDICGNLRCSECNVEYPDLYPDYDETNFCPNCGASMRGDLQGA